MGESSASDANICQHYSDLFKEPKVWYKEDLHKWLDGIRLDDSKTLSILNQIFDKANRLLDEDPE